jgi:ubiquinone/menaquinone biosynthesis C-methylase UbiE
MGELVVVEKLSRAVRRDVNQSLGLLLPHIAATDSVLDIGCGEAYVTAGIARRARDTWGADIVDLRRAPVPHFQQYDGLTLDLPDQRFDVVVLSFVLHHVPNELKPKLVGEARRVCRRTLLVIEDTPRNAFDRWTSQRHGESYRKKIGSSASFGFYSQPEWEQFFAREHFDICESRTLSRLCRDPLQPYARSFFVLRRLAEVHDHVRPAPRAAEHWVQGD